MGIRASYARVDAEILAEVRAGEDGFWSLPDMSWDLNEVAALDAAERLDLDKDWQVLSWLCSETGRAERRNETIQFTAMREEQDAEDYEGALDSAAERLGLTYTDPDDLQPDPVLSAIQGRRSGDAGEQLKEFGLACAVFTPDEVRAFAKALTAISEETLRAAFDADEMMLVDLPVDDDADLEDFCLPAFRRLRELYDRAAAARQWVVVLIA